MADWSKWGVDETYTNIQSLDDGKDQDAVRLCDTRATAPTNLPTYAKRWNNTLGIFQAWVSSAWGALTLAIAGGGTGATTAADARTNLGVYSTTQVDSAIDTDVATHNAVTATPHGAVSAATASKIIVRDAAGRAKVATPDAPGDIATKGYVDGVNISGFHTLTPSPGENCASQPGASPGGYTKIGRIVSAYGRAYVAPTATGVMTTFYLTLPVATNLGGDNQLAGTGVGVVSSGVVPVSIRPDTAGDRMYFKFYPISTSIHMIHYTVMYWD